MKQLTEKTKKNLKIIISIIIAIIILAGMVVVGTIGFNKELRYEQTQGIEIYFVQQKN